MALAELTAYLAPALGRAETRASGGAFIDGLLSAAERKTEWLLAEEAGLGRPYRIQSLLGRSAWSADALRALVQDYVTAALDQGGVLVVDETGFLKKGARSVGVARQYSGTAGRIENCQVGVFLGYASRFGNALIDRRLYLPKAWAEVSDRRSNASVPEDVAFATKPTMAREMIAAALDGGVSCA
jgi:SRSO17 transposase